MCVCVFVQKGVPHLFVDGYLWVWGLRAHLRLGVCGTVLVLVLVYERLASFLLFYSCGVVEGAEVA